MLLRRSGTPSGAAFCQAFSLICPQEVSRHSHVLPLRLNLTPELLAELFGYSAPLHHAPSDVGARADNAVTDQITACAAIPLIEIDSIPVTGPTAPKCHLTPKRL